MVVFCRYCLAFHRKPILMSRNGISHIVVFFTSMRFRGVEQSTSLTLEIRTQKTTTTTPPKTGFEKTNTHTHTMWMRWRWNKFPRNSHEMFSHDAIFCADGLKEYQIHEHTCTHKKTHHVLAIPFTISMHN